MIIFLIKKRVTPKRYIVLSQGHKVFSQRSQSVYTNDTKC